MTENTKQRATRTRRWAALLVALGAVLVGLLTGTGTASAATYNGVCGSGYGVKDQHSITGGTIFLTYSGSTGNNCVVTIRNTSGTAIYMDAFVRLTGALNWNDDPGYWTTYAGPVYVHAPGRCIDWGGSIGSVTWAQYNSHCG
ncbi:spore-associated protein A [Amycolatopsis sp. NPDC051102]|uniref:spore-associated protein A n=1 Tax=Amycolatopsis sp. NPDC051102 TaxID=3155163 RepID=UPI00341688C1